MSRGTRELQASGDDCPGKRDGGEAPEALAEGGASAIEYALLLGLIAIVIFAAMMLLGFNVSEFYSSIATGY